MDIVKGLTRLQANLESLLASTESTGCPQHLKLLKRCHSKVSYLIANPTDIQPAALDQLAIELVFRVRNQDQVMAQGYDQIALGFQLLSRMRQAEIERSYGPASTESSISFNVDAVQDSFDEGVDNSVAKVF